MLISELVVCLICVLGFGFLLVNSLSMPHPQTFWDGPGAFPTFISIILLIVCFTWLFDLLRAHRQSRAQSAAKTAQVDHAGSQSDDELKNRKKKERKSFITIGILVVLYIMALMPLLPFPIATFIFLMCSFLIFSTTKWWKLLIISGSVSGAVYLIFIYVLHLPMPR